MNKSFIILSLLLAIFYLGSCLASDQDDGIVQLTTSNFEFALKENPYAIVLFYDSHKLIDIYEIINLTSEILTLEKYTKDTLFGVIDIQESPQLGKQFKMHTAPHLVFYYFSIPLVSCPLDEAINDKTIQTWSNARIGKTTKSIYSEVDLSAFKKSLEKNQLHLIFIGKTTSPKFSLASKYASIPVNSIPTSYVLSSQTEWMQYFKLKPSEADQIFFINGFQKSTEKYEGSLTVKNLYDWIEKTKFPNFFDSASLQTQIYADYYKEYRSILFLFYPENWNAEGAKKYADILKESSIYYLRDSINTIFVHLKKDEADDYLWKINITVPSVFIIENLYNKLHHKRYLMLDEITPENIYKFYEKWTRKEVPRHFKNQDLSSEVDEYNITILNRNNFEKFVLNSTTNVFVFFYTVWGYNAQTSLKTLSQVKQHIENSHLKDIVTIARCDASLNDIPGITPGLQRFSALYLKGNQGNYIAGNEIRDANSVIRFIERYYSGNGQNIPLDL